MCRKAIISFIYFFRRSLQRTLKDFSLGWLKSIPLDAGEVSAGGVALQEIHPGTMESRVCSDLFLCGELLDYTGEVGGFNLQAAFSTGWLAGSSIRYPVQA
ncbi:MAG: NAD(P)/FAD-dependent oxidoreductase [Chlorobium phaeobacteroides]|nr:NAD(P)/FAD-dependent oxidoreductase [Chlorobium phaeobacteroides]